MLNINTLIEYVTEESATPKVERILHYDSIQEIYVLIDIFNKPALPVLRTKSELTNSLDIKNARLLQIDPFVADLYVLEKDIPEKYKQKRDRAWETIAPVVKTEGLDPYLPTSRGLLIRKAVQITGIHKKVIYEWLIKYWQGGKSKNALLPKYKKCGTNNKWRIDETSKHKRIGRPNQLQRKTGKTNGIQITTKVKQDFKRGIKKYYERLEKSNLRWAYRRTLNDFFHIGYEIKDGVPVPILPDASCLPTFRQFYYWYEKEFRNPKQELTARFGKREFEMNYRALLNDSTTMAFGPGSVYQIDATIGDIYLVNEMIRSRIIGRPVVYIVIDVFSRYIVGIAVTLEGPSWLGAMLALDNVVTDKVAFCAEYGITIKPENWNCQSLSEAILADRGEFESYSADSLVNNLGIRIQNTPPYRGDFKGIVERAFGKANENFIHFLPGAVEKARVRGEKDYRLDAVLTLREFYALLIQYVLNYNSSNFLSWYRKDEFQISDQVELYPQDLWDWGIENRSGHLRTLPQEIVRLNLLPRKQASITEYGIHFEKEIYYTCELARNEGWFERARQRKSWKVEIAYDPRNLNNIYIPSKNGQEMATCYLTPAAKVFHIRDWYSAADYFESKLESKLQNQTRELQSDAEFYAKQQQIISEASEKTKIAQRDAGNRSKKSQTENIRQNRAEEREMERSRQFFDLTEDNNSKDEQKIEKLITEVEEDEYVPPASNLTKISEIRKRKMGK